MTAKVEILLGIHAVAIPLLHVVPTDITPGYGVLAAPMIWAKVLSSSP